MVTITHPQLGEFTLIRLIGTGTFSQVYLAQSNRYGFLIAIKITSSDGNKEFELTAQANHPLIIGVYDYFHYDQYNCILMEYIDGLTLLEYANTFSSFTEEEARNIFVQLLISINFLHNKANITHRDIKLENVMLDRNNSIRLIDFGFAHKKASLFSTPCGSPNYAAPEIIHGNKYTKAVDIWSLGVILYAITVGRLPFEDKNSALVMEKILNQEPVYPDHLSPHLRHLLQGMMCKSPNKRLTIPQIKNHPWLKFGPQGNAISPKYDILDNLDISLNILNVEMEMYHMTYDPKINDPSSAEAILANIVKKNMIVAKLPNIFGLSLVATTSLQSPSFRKKRSPQRYEDLPKFDGFVPHSKRLIKTRTIRRYSEDYQQYNKLPNYRQPEERVERRTYTFAY